MLRIILAMSSLFCFVWNSQAGEPRRDILDKQRLLDSERFWDNRDWEWYARQIPFFDCPDKELQTTYYYRWELLTKHLTYGSPQTGYCFTEFIDRPFWSGTYGSISCPAGHQLYEARWLRDPRIAQDYARYWFRTPGAEPRRYSCWIADAIWGLHLVHPSQRLLLDLQPDIQKNFEGWKQRHYDADVGLFWQTPHDDGMEYSIVSRQTQDIVRGGPGYRPTLNSYLWADALALARIARLARNETKADNYEKLAASVKSAMHKRLWDPKRQFFFHASRRDETAHGHTVKALSLTHQTGKFAGSEHGRELYGYVPWQFNLPDRGYESAWRFLSDPANFAAPFGPTTTERRDPMFHLSKTCCWWSGQSWPYATSQTLTALANVLNNYPTPVVSKTDYCNLLFTYSRTHRKGGRPYLAEAAHPDSGSFEGHDSYNHSEHYFHSGFIDQVITGLVGLRPQDTDTIVVNPLVPDNWDYFAIVDVPYRGHRVAIIWDRDGNRYGLGKGLHLQVDGQTLATSATIEKLVAKLPQASVTPVVIHTMNFAVNNDGDYYPRVTASYAAPRSPATAINDGNYWYHRSPPNRWTCEKSPNDRDWCVIDLGTPRLVHTIKLYPLDDSSDGGTIATPSRIELEYWTGTQWKAIVPTVESPAIPTGRRANTTRFEPLSTSRVRATLHHRPGTRAGLTEFEIWGDAPRDYRPAPPPPGNLALNQSGRGFPQATASFTSRFDRVEWVNDGKISYRPNPHNRWTSYESPNASDWLSIDFGVSKTISRIELHIYDDRGGVQPPMKFQVQYLQGETWVDVAEQQTTPPEPRGGTMNSVRFRPVTAPAVRIVFTHRGKSRTGLTELEVWPE
jgi:hypothetical protein